MDKQLPVYRLTVTGKEDNGEEIFTALVDSPAIESNFVAFKNVEQFLKPSAGESQSDFMSRCIPNLMNEGKDQDQAIAICYKYFEGEKQEMRSTTVKFAADNDRRIITGAVMIPDMQIYRNDQKRGEHYVYFTKEDIELFVKDWAKHDRYNAVNEMHNRNAQPSGLYLIESLIVDSQRGVSAPIALKEDYPDGTWIQSYFVENDEVWSKVKSGEYKGFSMEMMVDYIFSKQQPNEQPDPIGDLIASIDRFIETNFDK